MKKIIASFTLGVLISTSCIIGYIKLHKEKHFDFVESLKVKNEKYKKHFFSKYNLKELAKGQHPRAIIVTCSDSRVEPVDIFDANVGDFFHIAIAGNVIGGSAIGSIEYALSNLNINKIIILGHTHCGAIDSTIHNEINQTKKYSQDLSGILNKITPSFNLCLEKNSISIKEFNKMNQKDRIEKIKSIENFSECVVDENVKHTGKDLIAKSKLVKEMQDSGKLSIYYMKYDIEDGEVEFFE